LNAHKCGNKTFYNAQGQVREQKGARKKKQPKPGRSLVMFGENWKKIGGGPRRRPSERPPTARKEGQGNLDKPEKSKKGKPDPSKKGAFGGAQGAKRKGDLCTASKEGKKKCQVGGGKGRQKHETVFGGNEILKTGCRRAGSSTKKQKKERKKEKRKKKKGKAEGITNKVCGPIA